MNKPIEKSNDLIEIMTMLAQRVSEWTQGWEQKGWDKGIKTGVEQGLEQGLEQEKNLLVRADRAPIWPFGCPVRQENDATGEKHNRFRAARGLDYRLPK